MRSSLLRILALIRKEFLAVLKDPRSRFIIFLPPMLQCLIFGYAASFDLNTVAYAVFDQDHSAASTALLSRLEGSTVFQRQATLGRADDIAAWINSGRALLVVQIDQDFERDLLAGKAAPLEVIASAPSTPLRAARPPRPGPEPPRIDAAPTHALTPACLAILELIFLGVV